MKKPNLFGICGKMGSGKNTTAEILQSLKLVDIMLGFADGVKECGQEYLDVDPKVRTYRSRIAWQMIGDLMREIQMRIHGNKDVWVNYAFKKINRNPDKTHAIFDVRYHNEMVRILEAGGILIFLDVPSHVRKQRIEDRDDKNITDEEWNEINSHQSEVDVEPENFYSFKLEEKYPKQVLTIRHNNSDLEDFLVLLKSVLRL